MQSPWFYLSGLFTAIAISVCFTVLMPHISHWKFVLQQKVAQARASEGTMLPRLGRRLWVYMPWTVRQHLRRVISGDEEGFLKAACTMLGIQVVMAISILLCICLFGFLRAKAVSPWLTIALVVIGASAPYFQYIRRQRSRHFQLRSQLPFFLDIFALSVEAGAGTVLALQSTVEALPSGPLKSLIEQALFDIRSGLSREHSFKKLALDSGIPELATLASSIENAVQMGLSLAPVLRSQSDQYRQERFLRAEKAALEAPVKMLLPIVSCIFPCTFLVIAYPIVYGLLSSL